jgi:hypothetical protein
MRLFLLTFFASLSVGAFGQLIVTQPDLYYFSKRQLEDMDWLKIGDKILFKQECSAELPPEVPTGIVFFENVYHGKEQFSMAIEFKDTVVVSVTYYLDARQTDVLKAIGYPTINGNESAVKGWWTYILDQDSIHTVMVGDRKKITIIQTLNK